MQPLEKCLQAIDGTAGKVGFKGGSLNKGLLADITKSAAKQGTDVGATIQETPTSAFLKVSLKNHPVIVAQPDVSTDAQKSELLQKVNQRFSEIGNAPQD